MKPILKKYSIKKGLKKNKNNQLRLTYKICDPSQKIKITSTLYYSWMEIICILLIYCYPIFIYLAY